MAEYLKLKKSNCVNCYKCIRHCPVKSIKYSTGQAQIVNDECILCGQCFVVCPQNAKEIRNDVPSAINLLKAGPVYASVGALLCGKLSWRHHRHHGKGLKAAGLCRGGGNRHWRVHRQDRV